MVVFRCTRKLLERLPDAAASVSARSTTALGDWYFTLVFAKPQWLLLGVSEKSRLPIVLPARELRTMTPRFREALERVVYNLAISQEAIAAERRSMEQIEIARTTDRHVVGSVNEFVHLIRFALEDRLDKSLHDLSLWLAETPILPLKDHPDRMTRRLLEARRLQ